MRYSILSPVKEKELRVKLVPSADGDISIVTEDGWFLVGLTSKGTIRHFGLIPQGLGFKLDSEGRILVRG